MGAHEVSPRVPSRAAEPECEDLVSRGPVGGRWRVRSWRRSPHSVVRHAEGGSGLSTCHLILHRASRRVRGGNNARESVLSTSAQAW
jgi:hypothetical protein